MIFLNVAKYIMPSAVLFIICLKIYFMWYPCSKIAKSKIELELLLTKVKRLKF